MSTYLVLFVNQFNSAQHHGRQMQIKIVAGKQRNAFWVKAARIKSPTPNSYTDHLIANQGIDQLKFRCACATTITLMDCLL